MSFTDIEKTKLQFSGHETFACKQFWIKKGFDFVVSNKSFTKPSAVVDLGVGKNMVAAIRYWIKSFNIIDEDDESPTEFANYFFRDNGFDPYIEDLGTLWMLHYQIIKKNKASIYSLLFNEFRKERNDFTKEQFSSFLKRKCNEESLQSRYNEKTVATDINVLLRSYSKPERKSKIEIEDTFANMFLDLELVHHYKKRNFEESLIDWYRIDGEIRSEIPFQIVFFVILDSFEDLQSISFRQLLTGFNSPGSIFALNTEGLYKKIIEITENFDGVVYNETAGNQILQLKNHFNKWEILNEYYN
ncbi:DUF4007 family protein [Flavobacterium frigoris]|uniref:DUF4007 domain-containing protein n=1 Tax=Flavobacterium frigoris TaxID=229204 RepID=A0A1H9MVW2_FLAFI|nr:DUF4007 family protein [Flavobacterium frigoris]SER27834.1 Protein of unknown function [Flavobacterium frigoris]